VNNPDRYTSARAKASGARYRPPGLIQSLFQRRVHGIGRRGGRGKAGSSSDRADVVSALVNLGYSKSAAKSAAGRASGSDFSSFFRSAQEKVRGGNPMATKKRKRGMPKALREYWAKKRGKKQNSRRSSKAQRRQTKRIFKRIGKGLSGAALKSWRKALKQDAKLKLRRASNPKSKRRNRTIIRTRTKIVRKVVYRNPPRRKSKSALTFPVRLKSSVQKQKIASWLGRNFKRK
jgi:hypothetical protein